MSDWDEDDWGTDDLPATEVPAGATAGEADAAAAAAIVSALVTDTVREAMRLRLAPLAQTAVDQALTGFALGALHDQANRAAGAAVSEQLAPSSTQPADEATVDDEAAVDDAGEAAPRLYYGSVDEFVREYLRNVYRRRVGGQQVSRKWAARWWQYDEAVIRLEALWRSWEHLRTDPATGMSVWWRDHADHHMAVLFDEAGPFAAADDEAENTNRKGEPLPYIAPPAGMFPDVRDDDQG